MKLALVLLLTFAPAVSARFGSWDGSSHWENHHWHSSSNLCQQRQPSCPPKTLSIEDRLALIARDNDHDYNGVVNYSDFLHDFSTNYDTNKDGKVSDEECVKRFACAYGLTDQVAQFVCVRLLYGEPCLPIVAFNVPPFNTTGVPLKPFLQTNRERFEQFCNESCVSHNLSVAEKVRLSVINKDHNHDGNVTSQDMEYDLSTFYDTDKDGQVSKLEWVARWTCVYGDTGRYARYMWGIISGGANSIPTTFFSGPPFDTGVSTRDFLNTVYQNYRNYVPGDASAQC